ncbi:hypothetical protein BUALT_Bualt03G0069800 [Buddleja alternifolia]|uniref:Uncharacterized protein n=1 Tax=Buddleja alternifolia TaxID=168488 RepID=A0AAV6Y2J0_9LAMI|nr:hypothetical protein BUALT_Bualt03G0069800 [Buddleja alternifolia]
MLFLFQSPFASTIHISLHTTMIYTLLLHLLLFPLVSTATASTSSIHDLLISRGLPAGLFPKNGVKSYELGEDGLLQVYLDWPCVAKFENRVFFESVVRANLSYGGLIGVEGLSQEELFLWLPVKDIIVKDPSSGLILFDIGVAHKQMSLSLFEDPPICNPQGGLQEKIPRKELGFEFQR